MPINSLIADSAGPLAETTVPAIVGLFIGLTILLFLFCFMFKLFTQSRWARARAYADAGRPPPTITLEGKFPQAATIRMSFKKQLTRLDLRIVYFM